MPYSMQAAHNMVLLYVSGSLDNASLMFFMICIVINCRVVHSLVLLDSSLYLLKPWSKLKTELYMKPSRHV